MGRIVPRTMATQHPDNARVPGWVGGEVIAGDGEVEEAFHAYSELGVEEVMWDFEGKDVDTKVVRKLLSMHGEFFREKVLGVDLFLTYRVPNPGLERAERKALLEALSSIPVSHDVASAFYGRDVSPIFEVILPFTTRGEELLWLSKYYVRTIAGMGDAPLDGALRVGDWLGDFRPKRVEVIPLVEDMPSLLNVEHILKPYIEAVKPGHMRVFLARSDPAMNYGLVSAVLLAKIALSKLRGVVEETGVEIYPIIGVGSLPFRGHLSPRNVHGFLEEYRGVHTVTVQSAFRYDYPLGEVREAIKLLNDLRPAEPATIGKQEVEVLVGVIEKFTAAYQPTVEKLSPLINSISKSVPPRRARKLHIGLFGYSRGFRGVQLPRAITFAAALYSLGIPPELLGMRALRGLGEEEWDTLRARYVNLTRDLEAVAGLVSWRNLETLKARCAEAAARSSTGREELRAALDEVEEDFRAVEEVFGIRLGPRSSREAIHENLTNSALISHLEGEDQLAREYIVRAAETRMSLG